MTAEKNLRGILRSEVDRTVSKDTIIMVDSLNSIKGYRYELWCLARAAGIRYCVLFCDVEEPCCRKWNQERWDREEPSYDDEIFEDLARRFEKPDRRNRWDLPLFELWPSRDRIEKSSDAIVEAVLYLTKRLRRTFVKLTGQWSLSGPPPPSDADSAKRMFADYFYRELST